MPDTTKKRVFDTYDATLDRVDLLTPRVKGFHFRFENGQTMNFKAGQFVQVFVPDGDNTRRSSYSIASEPHFSASFELCVTLIPGGKSSGFLHQLSTGDKVRVMGPFGKFTLPPTLERDIVFVATGSGIAPFRSMIQYLLRAGIHRQLYLVFGNRFEDDVIYHREWDALQKKYSNLHVRHTLSRPTESWKGARGYVQECIRTFVPDLPAKDVYICGLKDMIMGVQEGLLLAGVPLNQIHYERYD